MGNTLEAVHLLEVTLKNLLSNYDFLIKENQILLQNNSKLQHQVLELKINALIRDIDKCIIQLQE